MGRAEDLIVEETRIKIGQVLEPLGFEVHPFLIGWYNDQVRRRRATILFFSIFINFLKVSEKFRLPYPDSTLSFVVISQPSMFEKAFLPFLRSFEGKELQSFRQKCLHPVS